MGEKGTYDNGQAYPRRMPPSRPQMAPVIREGRIPQVKMEDTIDDEEADHPEDGAPVLQMMIRKVLKPAASDLL